MGAIQSASSFDGPGECFNPTQAGSRADGTDPTSSSVLIKNSTSGYVMRTVTNLAFWLLPGKPYGKPCGETQFTTAQNTTIVSATLSGKAFQLAI
ncbi:MAG TPA: hypothetical protein VFU48_02720 [Nitrospira sp.]|nr:hypothetical protein [Nitrospira sp.]